jgi:hypothetical protein
MLFVEKFSPWLLFPPQDKKAFHEAVLVEILEERVVKRKYRQNPRGVKRKMSSYSLRPRGRGKTQIANADIIIVEY